MMDELDSVVVSEGTVEHEPAEEDFPFRLVCRRTSRAYNSSCLDRSTHRGRPYNPAFMHPTPMSQLSIEGGDLVVIESEHSSVVAVAEPDPGLRIELVSMSHCYGGPPQLDGKVRSIGTSVNRLVKVDAQYDRLSGQPRMSNVPVRVRRLAATAH